jgi:hypothetical protein
LIPELKSYVCSNFSAQKQKAACKGEIGEYKLSKDIFAPYTYAAK